jgi:hypothetical protein
MLADPDTWLVSKPEGEILHSVQYDRREGFRIPTDIPLRYDKSERFSMTG